MAIILKGGWDKIKNGVIEIKISLSLSGMTGNVLFNMENTQLKLTMVGPLFKHILQKKKHIAVVLVSLQGESGSAVEKRQMMHTASVVNDSNILSNTRIAEIWIMELSKIQWREQM